MSALAKFDASAQRRRGLLAKVHIARQEMGLIEDDYRAVLLRVVGQTSAKTCSEGELEDVLVEFRRLGWKAKPFASKAPGERRQPRASHPVAGKARALWISLHELGAIEDASERALEAFARRQLGVDRLQWANQTLGYKLIEALKAIAERHGWDQSLEGVKPDARVVTLKRRLAVAQLKRLQAAGIAPIDWTVRRAAREFGGVEIGSLLLASLSELDAVSKALAKPLRTVTTPGARS